MSTVLVVDDRQDYVDMHVQGLNRHIPGQTVITALSLEELDVAYDTSREELAAIILDGCIPGDDVNTYPFISKVSDDRAAGVFTGLLIAASSDPKYRRLMVLAGCTHQSEKDQAAELVAHLLQHGL